MNGTVSLRGNTNSFLLFPKNLHRNHDRWSLKKLKYQTDYLGNAEGFKWSEMQLDAATYVLCLRSTGSVA
jgi:hypothetical protein